VFISSAGHPRIFPFQLTDTESKENLFTKLSENIENLEIFGKLWV
jgi:hypothetical protein